MSSPTVVPIDTIDIDERLQIRTEDQATFERRIAALVESGRDNPSSLPPLHVVLRGRELLLLDGHATLAALYRLGAKTALVIVEAVADSELAHIERAWELNTSHGFTLTTEDRKAHARWRRSAFPSEPIVETARRCGLSRDTVRDSCLAKTSEGAPRAATPDPYERAIVKIYNFVNKSGLAELGVAKVAKYILDDGSDDKDADEVNATFAAELMKTANFLHDVAVRIEKVSR